MIVVREIDRGGFGVVEEVEHNGEHFARKTFDPPAHNEAAMAKLRKRFAREVKIQSQIKHPNIMPICGFELQTGSPWFLMPLATQSFQSKIEADRTAGSIDPGAWQDILAAVEELHRLGYVHRDLKPANILCVDGTWVLADFGLILPAIAETTAITGSNSAYGTYLYAAPEQASDFHNVTEAADIFALGCILHDNVCQNPTRVPFAQAHFDGRFGPIIENCTAPDTSDRYANIAALRAALSEVWGNPTDESAISKAESDLLGAVTIDPSSQVAWIQLIQHVEDLEATGRHLLMRQISGDLLIRLQRVNDALFGRMMNLACAWVESTGFDFSYCDVVGDRLVEVFRVSPVRVQCQIVLAVLELAVSHNRWHVMHQVHRMLDQDADANLVDRFMIEMALAPEIEDEIRELERVASKNRGPS
ncbi:MAG: serine/threonine-protein kinase [Terracidiphilus sp.]